ncbi:MAG: hypothetical protein A3D44_01405 [Candidatus Staskawiczbacteria bacterium RIFCSPHIGHO2_02_FULL_42_22]|uniref:Uncharacterized protein n=1 Tax=Candidatus Staskawiczbacteria bacterium RIFCSPHIGHO2_02_FULL_42_22 TaxID=1802207 RepID=A0A1G2I1J9_9BACT|nr:MAG: hypothetical protein A3D44_01405 [Candidatus Staskawiczbacteria bacterium RIFCSPHIGHO2_02_FULL_42_22]
MKIKIENLDDGVVSMIPENDEDEAVLIKLATSRLLSSVRTPVHHGIISEALAHLKQFEQTTQFLT